MSPLATRPAAIARTFQAHFAYYRGIGAETARQQLEDERSLGLA